MKKTIYFYENGIHLVIDITDGGDVRLIHLSSAPFDEKTVQAEREKWFRLAEIQVSGENQDDHHGSKHTGTMPGKNLIYRTYEDYVTPIGRKLEISMDCKGLSVTCHVQFYNNIQVIRSWTEVKNEGDSSVGLEYVSSFCLTGIAKEGLAGWAEKSRIHIPHNTWYGEGQWKKYLLPELGLTEVNKFSLKRIAISSTGTWPSSEYLPMGGFENREVGTFLLWQIESSGSWHWEISDISEQLYLQLSGPTAQENQWWKNLKPGETFTSVPAAVAFVNGSFEQAVAEMTKYRRIIRRVNKDNETLPVIFNDYMNCLCGDPTTEKLLPLIDAASTAGCEYFCIDAGWYSDGEWWDGVGEWLPSVQRFPNGIKEPLEYIRSKGMIPGLWLELEVMGINCPLAEKVSKDWFFQRYGKPVIDHGRYQLDFRNPEVIAHADAVMERLVEDYGVGYIKMDYNIDGGAGTEHRADSLGEGLLEHNRAYLAWLDSVFKKYPGLVIENCSSGGMRMEYSLLSRTSIQSCTDQTDYRKMAAIAAASPSAVTPEQGAIWSYPLENGDSEEVIFNMVNCMLMRIHQSGHLAEISAERFDLVKEGINYYKKIRGSILTGLPFWPLGMPSFKDEWISMGLNCGSKVYIAVWRLEGENKSCTLPVSFLQDRKVDTSIGYPCHAQDKFMWNANNASLSIVLEKQNTARLFELDIKYKYSKE